MSGERPVGKGDATLIDAALASVPTRVVAVDYDTSAAMLTPARGTSVTAPMR